jgi:hypothetical protein
MAVINASQINSRAGETLYRVSRDLDVLKCWIDPHKVIRYLVVIRHRLAGRADGSVAMRISIRALNKETRQTGMGT